MASQLYNILKFTIFHEIQVLEIKCAYWLHTAFSGKEDLLLGSEANECCSL